MNVLVVGFDSAWSAKKRGALAGVIWRDSGAFLELCSGVPRLCNFAEADTIIRFWQREHGVQKTIVLLDQPTVVSNLAGQRPVENLVSSVIGRHCSAVQPANLSRQNLFGANAPVWSFLARFGGAADPLAPVKQTAVIETYPALALIALDWVIADPPRKARLPKYNPDRRSPTLRSDWEFVCTRLGQEFRGRNLPALADWVAAIAALDKPSKPDQDRLDACICLLVGLHILVSNHCLMIGSVAHGYMVVPYSEQLKAELLNRCAEKRLPPSEVTPFKLTLNGDSA